MSALDQFFYRLRALFRRRNLEQEMADEMRFHLNQRAAENVNGGLSPEEARYAAERRFGGVEQIKETARDEWGGRWFEEIRQDVRYALRHLRRNLGFTGAALGTLTLGIGATTAIFSVIHAVILKPLPYEQPGLLVQVWETSSPGKMNWVSPGVFHDWQTQSTAFEGFAALSSATVNVTGDGEPERIRGLQVSAIGLRLLRAQPIAGRIFAPDEGEAGRANVVVLTHGFWLRRFAGDPGAVGRNIALNDRSFQVVGILPSGFLLPNQAEFVTPLVLEGNALINHGEHYLQVYARLKPGVSLQQGQADLETVVQRSKPSYPVWKKDWSVSTIALQDQLTGDLKTPLFSVLGAVLFVLLIACLNVTNLLLAQASARGKEIALRAALGASRGRLVRQLLTESVLLALLGMGGGLGLAFWSTGLLRSVLGAMNVMRANEIGVDLVVLGVTVAAGLVTGLVFGLTSALKAASPRHNDTLKDAARGSASGGRRLRAGLIVGEVALALVLLVGAGLLLRSFQHIVNVAPGFNPANAFALELSLSDQNYPDNGRREAFYTRLAEEIAALPGIEAAGVNTRLALGTGLPNDFFSIVGRVNPPEPGYTADYDYCTSDYFRAMGIPLRRGRFFTPQDGDRVTIINQAMAERYFPGEDPLGRQLQQRKQVTEIVGIVGDLQVRGEGSSDPLVYRPKPRDDPWRDGIVIVRTTGEPLARVNDVRATIRRLDPALPVANVRSLADALSASVGQRKLVLVLLVLFAGAALLLAAIGLYGVVAYGVAQRNREFGIRVALGATRHDLLVLILCEGLKLVGLGLLLGLGAAWCLARLLKTMLYQVEPTDPMIFASVALLLVAVAFVASWLPARRAAKVDPMVALRSE